MHVTFVSQALTSSSHQTALLSPAVKQVWFAGLGPTAYLHVKRIRARTARWNGWLWSIKPIFDLQLSILQSFKTKLSHSNIWYFKTLLGSVDKIPSSKPDENRIVLGFTHEATFISDFQMAFFHFTGESRHCSLSNCIQKDIWCCYWMRSICLEMLPESHIKRFDEMAVASRHKSRTT